MKYFKIVPLVFIPLIILSCLDLRSCPDKISGKFICNNNLNAENYLILNIDGTFEHYYKEKDIILKHNGTWKRSNDGYCKLELSKWNNYNEKGTNYKEFGNGLFWINGNHLDIGPDGNSYSSFEKLN